MADPLMDEPQIESAEIIAALLLGRFTVRVASGDELVAVLNRDIVGRKKSPHLQPGSQVSIERSPYDPRTCRIVAVTCAAPRFQKGQSHDEG